jgi:hypothetical protein
LTSLPTWARDRPEKVDAFWQAAQVIVRYEVARQIAASFKDAFDEDGRPLENYEAMKQHATEIRDILAKHSLALADDDGQPCQLYAQSSDTGGSRYVLVGHGRQRHTVKRATVADCLGNPKVVARPLLIGTRSHLR